LRLRGLPYVLDPRADPVFPQDLAPDEHGLVAVGGELSERVLLEAYGKGIFPWFNAPPLMWFSPDPRTVLFPEKLHVPDRLARQLRQGRFQVAFDRDFEEVMLGCATTPRTHEQGTWIDGHFLAAYTHLHRLHVTHCVAVYSEGRLCGGLYGVARGGVFFGESMFSRLPNASKIALAHLVARLRAMGFLLIDCQARTEHLIRLGAEEIPRARFLELLAEGVETAEDVAFLRSINCQYAQGFYYGEPMSDRDVLQLLKMVRTAEHKLRPRGLFRPGKAKTKPRGKKSNGATAPAIAASAAHDEAPAHANVRPPSVPAVIANGAARTRPRSSVLGRMTPPPAVPADVHGMHEGAAGMQPQHDDGMMDDFAPPAAMTMPPLPAAHHGQDVVPPAQYGAPPQFDFDPGPPDVAMAPPPMHFDQFSPPPVDQHAMPPAVHQQAFGNGGMPYDAFSDAPMMEQSHMAPPPGMPLPFDQMGEQNPLVAAMSEEPPPHAPAPIHQPQQAMAVPRPVQAPLRAPQAQPQPMPQHHVPAAPVNGSTNGAKAGPAKTAPDFSGLPPAMAESLAKLAGLPWPPRPENGQRELEQQGAGAGPVKPRHEG